MNRTLKRVLGLAGSVALGVTGALTFASAAQAHHPEVTGTAVCVDDGWEVSWEVKLVAPPGRDGEITEINPAEPEIDGALQVGATAGPGEVLTGTQIYDSSATEAKLDVTAVWNKDDGKTESKWGKVVKSATGRVTFDGTCNEEPPSDPDPEISVHSLSDCFGIYVVANNNSEESLAEFAFTPSTGEPVTRTPEVGEDFGYYFAIEDYEAGLTVTVTADGEEVAVFEWDSPGNCEWGYIYDTCEGLEFELSIPEDGTETTFTFTPSEGEEVVETVAPGETKTVTFTATGDELTVSYIIDDGKNFYEGEVPWEKPEDCDEVPPSEAPTTPAAQLPVTGSSMTIMISAAAALVAAAAVLFFVARRRRAAADW